MLAHFIELFLPDSLVLVLSKNSKYFSRYLMKRVAKNDVFGPKNDLFWAVLRPKKLYFWHLGAKTYPKVVSDSVL